MGQADDQKGNDQHHAYVKNHSNQFSQGTFFLFLIGSVKDEVLNTEELALELLQFLHTEYPGVLAQRYGIHETEDAFAALLEIAESRGCLLKRRGF